MKRIATGVSWILMTVALAFGPMTIAHAYDTGHDRIGTAWSCRLIHHGMECKET